MYTIYKLINKINGKYYIGQTKLTLQRRSRSDGIGYKRSPYLYNAIQKYGWNNFEYEILDKTEIAEVADLLEISYIDYFDSKNDNFGYNIVVGGNVSMRGRKHTEETRRKISNANKGKPNKTAFKPGHKPWTTGLKRDLNPLTGRPKSLKQKLKQRQVALNLPKKLTQNQIDLIKSDTRVVKIIALEYGISKNTVRRYQGKEKYNPSRIK